MKRNKLLTKLVVSYAILFSIILCIEFAIGSYSYIDIIFKEKQTTYEQKLDIVLEELNTNIQKIYSLHHEIIENTQLRQLVEGQDARKSEHLDAKEILSELRGKQSGVTGIYLYDQNGSLLEYAANFLSEVPDFTDLPEFIQSKAYRTFSFQDNSLIYYGAFYLPERTSYQYKGYIAIELRPERFFYNMQLRAKEIFDSLYCIEDHKIAAGYGAEMGELSAEQFSDAKGGSLLKIGNNTYTVFRQRNRLYAEWEHVALIGYTEYVEEVWHLVHTLLGGIGISILCIVIISYIISKRITNPIIQVTHAMIQVEKGSYPPPLESKTSDETDDLIRGFNHMVSSLEKLNADVLREQEEKKRYEVEKVKAQLELLQSQINPHFIHNTLNGLKYMALTAGNRELAATITSFNTLLRASISTNTEFATVEEECRYVMEYMNIQKMRYASRKIEYSATVEPNALQALLPRLILQPLVENSLFHGILGLEEDKVGVIKIVCLVEQEFLHVYITDNGVGIQEEKLEKIVSGELRVTNGYNHVGLNNVKERLNLMYRTDCKFVIMSEYQRGTTIYFRVPYKEEE